MTESEWLTCTNPETLIDYITIGGGPVVSQLKLHDIEDAVFDRFGLNLNDIVMQDEPPAGACDIIRDIVGNPFRPHLWLWGENLLPCRRYGPHDR